MASNLAALSFVARQRGGAWSAALAGGTQRIDAAAEDTIVTRLTIRRTGPDTTLQTVLIRQKDGSTREAAFTYRRVKNDVKDAVLLADLLRLGSLPEAWVAPPGLRELRELGRGRHWFAAGRGT